jgi:hypothetical protein
MIQLLVTAVELLVGRCWVMCLWTRKTQVVTAAGAGHPKTSPRYR